MSAISFMLSGMLGAVAGIIIAPIALTQYDSGLQLGIKGFVACIIGGFGNPIGAALGGLLLGILEAFAAGYVSSGYKNAIAFVLLLRVPVLPPWRAARRDGTCERVKWCVFSSWRSRSPARFSSTAAISPICWS